MDNINYFVTDVEDIPQIYWTEGNGASYGGIKTMENYNLLATLLGDDPNTLLANNQTLVSKESLVIGDKIIDIQPFAYTNNGGNRKKNLPIGDKLRKFLTDPFDGEKFDLTLPFTYRNVGLSDRSGFLRISNNQDAVDFHVAIDFDVNGHTRQTFDVVAPADGIVHNSQNSGTLAILHRTPGGKEFLTVYQHLNPESKSHLVDNTVIKRGQKIGVLQDKDELGNPMYTHLHFGVALKENGVVDGLHVPEMWFLIDPFGVYDYRRNSDNNSTYNYLPNNNNSNEVKGVKNAFVFMTNPITGSFYYEEDCVAFDPDNIVINKLDSGEYRLESGNHQMLIFPNFEEASNALQIIKRNVYSKVCFIGRPNSSLQYFK